MCTSKGIEVDVFSLHYHVQLLLLYLYQVYKSLSPDMHQVSGTYFMPSSQKETKVPTTSKGLKIHHCYQRSEWLIGTAAAVHLWLGETGDLTKNVRPEGDSRRPTKTLRRKKRYLFTALSASVYSWQWLTTVTGMSIHQSASSLRGYSTLPYLRLLPPSTEKPRAEGIGCRGTPPPHAERK